MDYPSFASKVSFYEFLDDEFKQPHFQVKNYTKEIELLTTSISIETLAKSLEKYPKAIDVLEELFQLDHFTDSQFIHFCFDVNILNNADEKLLFSYIQNQIFNFENGTPNKDFLSIYRKISNNHDAIDLDAAFYTKRAIVTYVNRLCDRSKPEKRSILYNHIASSISTRCRIAQYIIENLNGKSVLSAVDVRAFLEIKRHPIDSKGLKGRFGHKKIQKILVEGGFEDVSALIKDREIPLKGITLPDEELPEFSFVKEKYVEGVAKRKTRKPKKFDFVILHNGLPRLLIETNFYSTSGGGTKIGINEGEYTDLHSDIQKLNNTKKTNMRFMWVTDGNYWLSKDGESRFSNLKENYFQNDLELLNFNLLKSHIKDLKSFLRKL